MGRDRIFHFSINVADLDRSISFYGMLGFTVLHRERIDEGANQAILAKFGQPGTNGAEYALIRMGDEPGATCIDLVQFDTSVPVDPPPVNRIGIGRIALQYADPSSLLGTLAKAGVELLGPAGRTNPLDRDAGGMFAFRDPDGVIVEIVSGLDHLVAP
jgi:catechol 2,3-dioxygenase-like lactoylglutathione lyase family enzyme